MLIVILSLIGGVILMALIMIPFIYPELFARGWKFLVRTIKQAAGRPVLKPEQEEAKAKAKNLAPYLALADQIEQITPGQTLRYKIAEPGTWGGGFVAVELNPQYPQKGRKYLLIIENSINGMPGGEKTTMYDTNNPVEVATSVVDRHGELFVVAEETPIRTEKVGVDAKKRGI
jgi:hypothetical protein